MPLKRGLLTHPYVSWERKLNKNANGLICQYFLKGRELTAVAREEIQHVANRLNRRSRETLGFRTPYETFFNTRTPLTEMLPRAMVGLCGLWSISVKGAWE